MKDISKSIHDFLARAESYRVRRGWSEATMGHHVAQSARMYPSFKRRLAKIERDMERIERLMAEKPAPVEAAE